MSDKTTATQSYEEKIKNAKIVVANDGSICLDFELEEVNARIEKAKEIAKEELKFRENQKKILAN